MNNVIFITIKLNKMLINPDKYKTHIYKCTSDYGRSAARQVQEVIKG